MSEVLRYRVQLPHGDADQFVRFGPGWTDLEVREGTSDEDVLREVWIEDCYRVRGIDKKDWRARSLTAEQRTFLASAVEIERGATIIDLGACTGIFAALCLSFGASRVICVEPEPDNLHLLARNTDKWRNKVAILPYAVAAEPGTVRLFGGEGTGHTEVGRNDGYAVEAVTLADVIERAGGPVALLKCDVEGAEFGAIRACPSELLARVQNVAMETHGPGIGCTWITDAPAQYGRMVAHLARTHAVSAFGDPANGGMVFAHRYES